MIEDEYEPEVCKIESRKLKQISWFYVVQGFDWMNTQLIYRVFIDRRDLYIK